jgi:hypothetical protein
MIVKKVALIGAIVVMLSGLWANAANATYPGDGGAPCVPSNIAWSYASYNSGTAFKVTISNNAGCGIEAFAHCEWTIAGGTTFWAPSGSSSHTYGTGNIIGTGTSTADCRKSGRTTGAYLHGEAGYDYYTGTSWHAVDLHSY